MNNSSVKTAGALTSRLFLRLCSLFECVMLFCVMCVICVLSYCSTTATG
jgi:hypothetical protein